MTSPPSFISSSDAQRYVRVLAVALAALIVLLLTITAFGYGLGLVDATNRQIYVYQRDKLEHLPPTDVAFVGDSSLGNAVDAALFGKLSGMAAANLALTGTYGAGGAYNMVYSLIARDRPRLIVVMLSPDTMRRADAFTGFFFSADPAHRWAQSPLAIFELYFSLKAARRTLDEIGQGGLWRLPDAIENDYITQRTHPMRRSLADEVANNPLLPGMVAPAQIVYLGKIAAMCREHGIVCVYAQGPIYAHYCRHSAVYLRQLDESVRAAGLDVAADTPICMETDEVGNSIDHVKPDLKTPYTQRYFERLQPFVVLARNTPL